jgi:hypothetical protein
MELFEFAIHITTAVVLIERILSRLSIEPGLAATSWQIVGQDA